jgi:hypothetical protein
VRFAGAGIEIDELAAIEVGEVLAIGRPLDILRQWADEGAVGKDLFDGERYGGTLRRGRSRQEA